MVAAKRLIHFATVLGLTGVGAAGVLAFVPSAEKELARLYPPILRGDLSACTASASTAPSTAASMPKFVRRMNGTWELRSRTVHGITVSSSERVARLYVDMNVPSAAQAAGAALLVDRPRAGSDLRPFTEGEGVAAFWAVDIGQKGRTRVSLTMTGQAVGSHANSRIRNIQDSRFFELKDVFVAVDRQAPASSAWDKIVLTERSMTYVSCENGVVERYTKVSSQKPVIEGLSLERSWQRLKNSTRVTARLLAPNAAPALTRGLQ
jgi:hypothetical protein